MKLFRSKDKKVGVKRVKDRAGNEFNIPVDKDGYVPLEEMQRKFASRYSTPLDKGLIRDLTYQSKRVYPEKVKPEDILPWWKRTNRYDVEGVDASPGTANYFPELRAKTKAEKKAEKKSEQAKKKTISKETEEKPERKTAEDVIRDELKSKVGDSDFVKEHFIVCSAPPIVNTPAPNPSLVKEPFVPRPMGEKESASSYKSSLSSSLRKWAGIEYTTIWSLEDDLPKLKSKYGPNAEYVQLVPGEFIYEPFRQQYLDAKAAINEQISKEKVRRKTAADSEIGDMRARVEARKAVAPKPLDATSTNVKYGQINENLARIANDANSFSRYEMGSETESYQAAVDRINEVATEHKKKVDPMYWPEIDRQVQIFADRYAEWVNRHNNIEASCPSILIAGPSGVSKKKKDKQNERRDSLWKDYQQFKDFPDKIRSIGTGGIRSSDENAVAKLEEKIVKLQDEHEMKVRINKAIRGGEGSKAFNELSEGEKEIAKIRIARKQPIPGYELTNETVNIRRLKDRLKDIERESKKRAEGPRMDSYPALDGLEVQEDARDNRIKLIFDDKPSEQARGILKRNGFRWSPRNSAWQRELNDTSRHAAKWVIEKLTELGGWQ